MRPFEFVRVDDVAGAVAAVAGDPSAAFLAGGTTQVDLMRDGVFLPKRVVDISRLPLQGVSEMAAGALVGALTTMEDLAREPMIRDRFPVVAEALLAGATVQLRNMATIGGNLLQRTRCRYFRDVFFACNKREALTRCDAMTGPHRTHAILGTSDHCFATHASDLAVALTMLDAIIHIQSRDGTRQVPLTEFYLVPGETPPVENVLVHGELITAIEIPNLPSGARSHYTKIRDRSSYDFALASAAVALTVQDGVIRDARIALGGVATIPWRCAAAEAALRGSAATDQNFTAAAEAALAGAAPRRDNGFKVQLAKRVLVRALRTVTGGQ